MDCNNHTFCTLVARLFWRANKPKLPKNWKLGSYFDRYRDHPGHFEASWDDIDSIRS